MQDVDYVYGLADYLRIVRERRRTVIVITAVLLLGSLLLTYLRTPEEDVSVTATGTPTSEETDPPIYVVIELAPSLEGTAIGGFQQFDPEMARLRFFSVDVLQAAANELGVDVDGIEQAMSVEAIGEGRVFAIRGTALEESSASDVGVAVADAYLRQRQDDIARRYRAAIAQLEAEVTALKRSDAATAGRIAAFETEIAHLHAERAAAEPGDVVAAPAFAPTAQPTSPPTPASVAGAPAAERPFLRNGIAGLVLGLILGMGIALLQDVLDPRFRTTEEVEQRLSLPVMAIMGSSTDIEQVAASVRAQTSTRAEGALALVSLASNGAQDRAGEIATHFEKSREGSPALVVLSPKTASSDYLSKAAAADGAVLVIDRDRVARADAVDQLGKLRRSGAEVLGVVLT